MVESSLHAPVRAFTAASAPLDIVHEDCHYLFVNKPAGLSVAGDEGSPDGDTFHDHVKIHVAENYGSTPANLLHQLDEGASGLMVFAKSKRAEKHFLRLYDAQHGVTDDYLAIVEGTPPKSQGRVGGVITKSKDKQTYVIHKTKRSNSNRRSVRRNRQWKPVLTTYKVLSTNQPETDRLQIDDQSADTSSESTSGTQTEHSRSPSHIDKPLSLMSLRPFTSRKHQLRASCFSLGLSIVGDKQYGRHLNPDATLDKHEQMRMLLHSHRIAFVGPPGSGPEGVSGPARSRLEQGIQSKQDVGGAAVQREGYVYDVVCEPTPSSVWSLVPANHPST